MMKKITGLVVMMALMMFAAVPAFASHDKTLVLDQESELFAALCSPFVEIDLLGCVFSDEDDILYDGYLYAGPFASDIVQLVGDQEAESGDVEQSAEVSNSGDNVNQCVAILNAANTGNVQNAQAVAQQFSEGDIEVTGSSITVSPELALECDQAIKQAAAAE